jgi:uncharacterized protein (DUF433 family)
VFARTAREAQVVTTRRESGMIVRDPRIQGGEPTIRGTRVPVRSIVLARDGDGLDPAAIAAEFGLDPAAVAAALAYYGAHKAEIDRSIDDHERAAGG